MKIKINLLLIIAAIGFASCDLEEKPYGFYTDDNFFNTVEDARSALYYAYNIITYREYTDPMYFINDGGSDEMNYASTGSFGGPPLDRWEYSTLKNNEQLELFYKYCFIGINRANSIIDNLQDAQFDKNQILGQALFLRAWHYFYLARNYGLIPLHRNMITVVDQARSPKAKDFDEVYDFIIEDLKTAASLMQVEKVAGLTDKVAAEALLSKVYLTIASAKESGVLLYRDMNKDVNEMYAQASAWAKKVLYDYPDVYHLEEHSLLDIYDVLKPDGPEHIFILGKDRTGTEGWNYSVLNKMFMPSNSNQALYFTLPGGGGTIKTSQGYGTLEIQDDFAATFAPADKRFTELMSKRYYRDEAATNAVDYKYYLTLKYLDPYYIGNGGSSTRPYLIRFSDIALVYAEAEGPTVEGYEWLNKIRERAGLLPAPGGMSVDGFRNYVVTERSFELAYEANRLSDLRRKGIVTATDPHALLAGITEDEATFYPTPQKEIDLNPNF